MGGAVVALEPVEHVLLTHKSPAKALPEPDVKSRDLSKQVATVTLIVDEPRRSNLRETAQKALEAVEMQGGSGLCEVRMRIDAATGEISVLKVNASPKIFYPRGSSPIDKVIELTYPGAHAALFDMLLATKSIQTKAYHQSHEIVCNFYRNYSKTYDNAWDLPIIEVIRHVMAVDFDWSGRVLDLCCGSGLSATRSTMLAGNQM
ncbi:hypothetical protein LY78DRAFT_727892 [Colletotrichum sublineola]|nr:hypothetical protein LY78DRAFT_727892 [Colletotrichum sublineola]